MPSSVPSASIAEFGVFEADLRSGELRKCGVKVKIQELPFLALQLLVTHPNEVLSRDDFRHALWPDGIYVDFDRGVISAINRLRETLGDSAENPIFIETVGRRGYRWIASTQLSDFASEEEREERTESERAGAVSLNLGRWRLILATSLAGLLAVLVIFGIQRVLFRAPANSDQSQFPSRPGDPRPSANREAQEFYLKGRYYWEKRTPESLNKAVDAFTQAIVHDPSYAPAYVGLADCYNLLREYTVMPASEAYPRAFAAAKKAVELDPGSSQAHASLAFVSFNGMWDVATADREFRRAIELDPQNAKAHHWYATFLQCLRRYQESLSEIERARALNPTSKAVLADEGSILFSAGHRREATVLLRQIEKDEPDFISPHRYMKFNSLIAGDYPVYLSEARKEAVLMHDASAEESCDATEKGFASAGGIGLLEALSLQQKRLYDRGQLSPYLLAVTYSLMDNKKEALRYLKQAYDQRVDGVAQLEADHAFDNLADEPEFRKLIGDLGLPALK